MLIERIGPDGATQVLIDTGPDLVPQLLDADVARLDAVAYTHAHADHIHGIDDLRQIAYNMGRRVQVWADEPTAAALLDRFGYIFETPSNSFYPPVCQMNRIERPFVIDGAGGPLELRPFAVPHGEIQALGFRVGGLVYLPDVSAIPEPVWAEIAGCEVFICDGLRIEPHVSHANLAQAVEWIERSGAARGVVTNMHIDLDYEWVMGSTPDHIVPAFDGMVIEMLPASGGDISVQEKR